MFSFKTISFKRAVALISLVATPVLAAASDCSAEKKDATKAKTTCNTQGYHKTGPGERTAKGSFFTCGGPDCKIVQKRKDGPDSKDSYLRRDVKLPATFTIKKDSISWSAKGCGTIYKKNVK